MRPRVTGGDLGRGTHGWRSLRTRVIVGASGRDRRGPEFKLEIYEALSHGWSIGKRYEKPRVMVGEAYGLESWLEHREEVSEAQIHGWRSFRTRVVVGASGRGRRAPEFRLEIHEALSHGWSIGKRYERPRVMVGEASGLDYGWRIWKRYVRPGFMVGGA